MGFFYKFGASSMISDFNFPEGGRLTPYTALVFFAVGVVVSNFLFDGLLMRFPFAGKSLSISDYLSGTKKIISLVLLVASFGIYVCRLVFLPRTKQALQFVPHVAIVCNRLVLIILAKEYCCTYFIN